MPTAISLKDLTKCFTNGGNPAVDRVTLDMEETEFLTIVGPSGCGKSTLMRLIAAWERPTSGHIYINGQNVDTMPAHGRNIGFLSKDNVLFPHMTVAQNVELGLKTRRVPKRERRRRIGELMELMGLDELKELAPHHLTVAQHQRVALARALAPRPHVLLLDEPFGALFGKERQQLRADTMRWQRALKVPTVLTTRDQPEAMEPGDRFAIMNQGRIERLDTPSNVCDCLGGEVVSRFIGSTDGATEYVVSCGEMIGRSDLNVTVVHPEDIARRVGDSNRGQMGGQILDSITKHSFLGHTVQIWVQLRDGNHVPVAIPIQEAIGRRLEQGAPVALGINRSQDIRIYEPRVESPTNGHRP